MKTTILLDHEPVPQGHVVRALLRLEGDVAASGHRRPLNISLALDRSGSMAGPKLVAARQAAAQLVRRIAPADVASVVAFDDQVAVVAPPAAGAAQADLPRRIEQIESGGSTNLSGGWLRSREFVSDGLLVEGVNRVLLLTDGRANVGITDRDALVGLCTRARAHGISTTTIGFGADYDEDLLRAMAEAGGGNTFYIEAPDQAAAIFADELEGLFGMSAQNLRVTIVAAPAVTLAAVHHEYPRSTGPDGALGLDLGDLYAREPKALLCEFLVGALAGSETIEVARLLVTADVITAEGIDHRTIALPISASLAEGPRVDAEVRRELLLLESARARRDAVRAQRAGDYDTAHTLLATMEARLRASDYAGDVQVAEDAADLQLVAEQIGAGPAAEPDLKYLQQRAYNRASSRALKDELIRRQRRAPKPEPDPKP
ncbi:MAG TPA: VWA domain-containing protein [Longimicrobiales bacterium]|nr:VWA domain-containing protein [Longimicrobiales bacterium]